MFNHQSTSSKTSKTLTFPNEGSEKFNPAAFVTGATYKVQGSTTPQGNVVPQSSVVPTNSSPIFLQGVSRYGMYQVPRCPPSSNPVPHPPAHVRRKTIQKTVLLAKVAARDGNKPYSSRAGRLSHTIITSIIVKLDHSMGECNVTTVVEMVKNQIGFDVILLDSKLYPLIANDSTSGLDYWKSTRKIIATSRSVYEKLVGKSPAEQISRVDNEVAIIEPPAKKVRVAPDDEDTIGILESNVTNPLLAKLEEVEKALSSISQKLVFVDDVKKGFECIICRLPCKSPVVASCCQHIVGCNDCVKRWREAHSRCPHCLVASSMTACFVLKGIDEITGLFHVKNDREELGINIEREELGINIDADTVATCDDLSNEFDELPSFCTANAS